MLSRHQSKEQTDSGNMFSKFNSRHSLAKRLSYRSVCADKYTHPPMRRASPWFLLSPNENSGRKYSGWKLSLPPSQTHLHGTSGQNATPPRLQQLIQEEENLFLFIINYKRKKWWKKCLSLDHNLVRSVFSASPVLLLDAVWVTHSKVIHTPYGQRYVDTLCQHTFVSFWSNARSFQVTMWRG